MSVRQAVSKLWKAFRDPTPIWSRTYNKTNAVCCKHDFGGERRSKHCHRVLQWAFLTGQAVFLATCPSPSLAEDVSVESSSGKGTSVVGSGGLRKVEDGSLISNEHTSKWRIFTDNGRDYFSRGNVYQAEKFFKSALQEARKGFGERDPHVAAACNNLRSVKGYALLQAELFRIKKDFDSAEPLYVEAIDILEEHFGKDDVRVGAAVHNLGQFFMVQQKLENARACYERALKIKRRTLGDEHADYADTMYRLGTVLHLQGEMNDSVDLISNSIRILEAAGQGESVLCVQRMQQLSQMYIRSNRSPDAVIWLRKILHNMELSKGWESMHTVVAAEKLALAVMTVGKLKEAEELFEKCLEARQSLIPNEHKQNAALMYSIATVKILIAYELIKTDGSKAMALLDMAKSLLHTSIRLNRKVMDQLAEQKEMKDHSGVPGKARRAERDRHLITLALLESLNALGTVELFKLKYLGSKEYSPAEAEAAMLQCISTFEFESEESISDDLRVKAEYVSCLKLLNDLIGGGNASHTRWSPSEIQAEIQRIQDEVSKSAEASS